MLRQQVRQSVVNDTIGTISARAVAFGLLVNGALTSLVMSADGAVIIFNKLI